MKFTVLFLFRSFQGTIHLNEEEEDEEDEEEEEEEEEVEEQAFGSPPPTPSFLQFTATPSLFHYPHTIAQVDQVAIKGLVVPLIFVCFTNMDMGEEVKVERESERIDNPEDADEMSDYLHDQSFSCAVGGRCG